MPISDLKLSNNFSLFEFCRASNHVSLWEENTEYASLHLETLRLLATDLEIIRARFNIPLFITSGIRCPALNAAVGGVETSQHLKGEAVDFTAPNGNLLEIFSWIVKASGLPFGQTIYERKNGALWIHYSLGEPYREPAKCRQALVFDGKQYNTFVG